MATTQAHAQAAEQTAATSAGHENLQPPEVAADAAEVKPQYFFVVPHAAKFGIQDALRCSVNQWMRWCLNEKARGASCQGGLFWLMAYAEAERQVLQGRLLREGVVL